MTVVERFLKLVFYPTTSDEASETCPSTAQQLALAQELVRQMQDMGIADARVDKDGYVYGTVPANCEKDCKNRRQILLLCQVRLQDK